MKKKISKKTTFEELLQNHPETIEILFEKGMHCIGCPMSQGETIEQGAFAHGLNPDDIIKEINDKINNGE